MSEEEVFLRDREEMRLRMRANYVAQYNLRIAAERELARKMSEEELFLWWHDLPSAARLYYTGSTELDPEDLPWREFRTYRDLDSRVYRPFNPETMNWREYKETSDYLVAAHHARKQQHELEDEARKSLLEKHGFALAPTYQPDMQLTMRDVCEGCLYQRPAQRDHRCLDPQNENPFL